jgi:hypothetical protein
MRSFKTIAAVGSMLALIVIPSAMAGGDAGPALYPSIVNVPLVRTEAALQRAQEYADTAQVDKALAQLTVARSQMRKAWTGEKYVIATAPPPVAGSGAVSQAAGGAIPGASPYADQYATGLAVFNLQHEVAATAVGLTDTGGAALLAGLSTTLFAALNARDASIAYIKSIDVAPAPAGRAHSAGGLIAAGWGPTMSSVTPMLDDEIQQIEGTLKGTVSVGAGRVLRAADFQAIKAERLVNQYWPPLPAG